MMFIPPNEPQPSSPRQQDEEERIVRITSVTGMQAPDDVKISGGDDNERPRHHDGQFIAPGEDTAGDERIDRDAPMSQSYHLPQQYHPHAHFSHRAPWLRASVLGAMDGLGMHHHPAARARTTLCVLRRTSSGHVAPPFCFVPSTIIVLLRYVVAASSTTTDVCAMTTAEGMSY